ncbi:MAG: kelch repeat-containing protein [Planctomycetota bacterium]
MLRIPRLPLALAALAAASPLASARDVDVTRDGGVLGELLTYTVNGDPFETFYLVVSISQGPLPVALFCPGDPRLIEVGTELQSLATLGLLDGGGNGVGFYPVPLDPSFQGLGFFAQALTLPGATCLIDDLSPQNAFTLAQHDTVHNALGDNVTARQGHTATTLPDGRVLIVGGDEPDMAGVLTALDTMEVFDPQTQRFTALSSTLTAPRSTHTATLLDDGRVLVVGGYNLSETVVATADIIDPVADTVVAAAPMSVARTQHTATLLDDGRVLVVAGSSKFDTADILGSLAQVHRTAEIYDPGTDSWSAAADLPISDDGIAGHAASRLGNGQVLVSAGVDVDIVFGVPIPSMSNNCHRYQPSTNSWLPTANLPGERVYHGQVTLPNGTALVAGGADGDFVLLSFNSLSSCATYNATTNSWTSVASLNHPRAYPNLLMAGDEVVIVGGLGTVDVSTASGTPEQNIEAAPTTLLSWTSAAAMALPREVGRAAAVDGGDRVVIVGTGDNGVPTVDRTAEVYVR